MQIVCAVSHTKKQYMRIGHEKWGQVDLTNIPAALEQYGPCTVSAIDQYKHFANEFGVEEVVLEPNVTPGYTKVRGFWEQGVGT